MSSPKAQGPAGLYNDSCINDLILTTEIPVTEIITTDPLGDSRIFAEFGFSI